MIPAMSESPHPTAADPMIGLRQQRQMPLLRQGFHRQFQRKTFAEIEEVMRQALESNRFPGSPRKPSSSTPDSH